MYIQKSVSDFKRYVKTSKEITIIALNFFKSLHLTRKKRMQD